MVQLSSVEFSWAQAETPEDETSIEEEITRERQDLIPEPPDAADQRRLGEDSPEPPKAASENAETTPSKKEEPPNENLYDRPLKASSSSGEKIFDWSKQPSNAKQVPHPFAEKGLVRITKDRTYIYLVKNEDHHRAGAFRVGLYDPAELANPDTGATFAENYDQRGTPFLMFDYEWRWSTTPLGRINLQVGSGVYVAQGHGHFVGDPTKTPLEVLTFALIPANFGVVYRMSWSDHQLLMPYGGGGGTLFGFTELRDDDKGAKFGGSLGAYVFAGVGLNLTYFDALSRIQMEREYGISSVHPTAEFRELISINKDYDFTSDLLNAGFFMEF